VSHDWDAKTYDRVSDPQVRWASRLAPAEHKAFVRAVADRLPDRRIDYVRLNALARLRGSG
jgi:hypothetical protein